MSDPAPAAHPLSRYYRHKLANVAMLRRIAADHAAPDGTLKMNADHLAVFVYLATLTDPHGHCHASRATIAAALGKSEKWAQLRAAELAEAGVIKKITPRVNSGLACSFYLSAMDDRIPLRDTPETPDPVSNRYRPGTAPVSVAPTPEADAVSNSDTPPPHPVAITPTTIQDFKNPDPDRVVKAVDPLLRRVQQLAKGRGWSDAKALPIISAAISRSGREAVEREAAEIERDARGGAVLMAWHVAQRLEALPPISPPRLAEAPQAALKAAPLPPLATYALARMRSEQPMERARWHEHARKLGAPTAPANPERWIEWVADAYVRQHHEVDAERLGLLEKEDAPPPPGFLRRVAA